jgi:hypothetical protein
VKVAHRFLRFGTANDCSEVGSDLGSPVSEEYFDQALFAFNGKIITSKIAYPKK